MEKKVDRQIHGQLDRQIDRQTGRQLIDDKIDRYSQVIICKKNILRMTRNSKESCNIELLQYNFDKNKLILSLLE